MTSNSPLAPTPAETREFHTRLVKCALAVEESRAYWDRVRTGGAPMSKKVAFEQFWFGAKSLSWVKEIVAVLRARFDGVPGALAVLAHWPDMPPETRSVICHWHTQFTDPLYRAFAGDFLVARRGALRPEVGRPAVLAWVTEFGPSGWSLPTRKQLASKLLTTGLAAGLISGRRDPRRLTYPRVQDDALAYLLHFLRGVTFEGSFLDNPYLRSVGLEGAALEARLRGLPSLHFRRIGDVVDFGWRYPNLTAWADAEILSHRGAA